jgi:hypothetical protein
MRIGRIVIGIATLLLSVSALTVVLGEGTAWATTTGTGLENCTAATGTIKYSPAWSDADSTHQIKAKIKITFTGCTGGTPVATHIKAAGTLKFTPSQSDNECTNAEEPGAVGSLKLTYGHGIASSTLTGPLWVSNPTDPYFEAESVEVVTGSYANNDAVSVPFLVVDEASATGNCTSGVQSVVLSGGEALHI